MTATPTWAMPVQVLPRPLHDNIAQLDGAELLLSQRLTALHLHRFSVERFGTLVDTLNQMPRLRVISVTQLQTDLERSGDGDLSGEDLGSDNFKEDLSLGDFSNGHLRVTFELDMPGCREFRLSW